MTYYVLVRHRAPGDVWDVKQRSEEWADLRWFRGRSFSKVPETKLSFAPPASPPDEFPDILGSRLAIPVWSRRLRDAVDSTGTNLEAYEVDGVGAQNDMGYAAVNILCMVRDAVDWEETIAEYDTMGALRFLESVEKLSLHEEKLPQEGAFRIFEYRSAVILSPPAAERVRALQPPARGLRLIPLPEFTGSDL